MSITAFHNCHFENNSAKCAGGAIYDEYDKEIIESYKVKGIMNITESIFTNNSVSDQFGGAFYLINRKTVMYKSVLSNNNALMEGGGIYIDVSTYPIS